MGDAEWEAYDFWFEGKRYHTVRSKITGEYAIPREVVKIAGEKALDVIIKQMEARRVLEEGR